jgi:hypothetical protein
VPRLPDSLSVSFRGHGKNRFVGQIKRWWFSATTRMVVNVTSE